MTLRTPTRPRTLQEHCARFSGCFIGLGTQPFVLALCVRGRLPCLERTSESVVGPPPCLSSVSVLSVNQS